MEPPCAKARGGFVASGLECRGYEVAGVLDDELGFDEQPVVVGGLDDLELCMLRKQRHAAGALLLSNVVSKLAPNAVHGDASAALSTSRGQCSLLGIRHHGPAFGRSRSAAASIPVLCSLKPRKTRDPLQLTTVTAPQSGHHHARQALESTMFRALSCLQSVTRTSRNHPH